MTDAVLAIYIIWTVIGVFTALMVVLSTGILFNSILPASGFIVFSHLALFDALGINSFADYAEYKNSFFLIYSLWCLAMMALGVVKSFGSR